MKSLVHIEWMVHMLSPWWMEGALVPLRYQLLKPTHPLANEVGEKMDRRGEMNMRIKERMWRQCRTSTGYLMAVKPNSSLIPQSNPQRHVATVLRPFTFSSIEEKGGGSSRLVWEVIGDQRKQTPLFRFKRSSRMLLFPYSVVSQTPGETKRC